MSDATCFRAIAPTERWLRAQVSRGDPHVVVELGLLYTDDDHGRLAELRGQLVDSGEAGLAMCRHQLAPGSHPDADVADLLTRQIDMLITGRWGASRPRFIEVWTDDRSPLSQIYKPHGMPLHRSSP